MDHNKLSDLLVKNNINGFILSMDNNGNVGFAKNCDPMGLMLLKTFADFNIINEIGKTLSQAKTEKAIEQPKPKMNLNIPPFKKP